MMPPFHLAFPVRDLAEARAFFAGLLGCKTGRSAPTWVDFDFFGHQISAHLCADLSSLQETHDVDGDQVPLRHFGLILPWSEWEALAQRLRSAGARFLIEPRVRFRGRAGEQATMFIADPSGNALEFKAFRSSEQIFATGD
jgi:extradiol dioxygenase family protein